MAFRALAGGCAAIARDEMTLRQRLLRPEGIAIAAVLAFAILRFAALTRYPLWTDETWTLQAGGSTLRRMLRIHADDQTHPPLFYFALWTWRQFGPDSLLWVRLLPCLASIATVLPLLAIARTIRLTARATALTVLLGAGSGMLVAYSAEVRSYAFLALAGTVSLALWLRLRDEAGTSLTRLTVVNSLLLYTHYFGVFVIAAEWIDALFWAKKRLRALTISAVIAGLSVVPWVLNTVRRAQITGNRLEVVDWIPRPVPGDLFDFAREAMGASPWFALDLALLVIACAAIGWWVFRSRATPSAPGIRVLLIAASLPVTVAFVLSVTTPRSMWVERYFIAAVPPLLLLAAGALDSLIPRRLTVVAVAAACIPAMFTAASLTRARAKPRYDLVVRAIADAEPAPPATVYSVTSVDAFPLVYAARAAKGTSAAVNVRTAPADEIAQAPAGWLVWSEVHAPPGIPPSAWLIRQGFSIDTEFGFGSDADSLVAVHFARPKAP